MTFGKCDKCKRSFSIRWADLVTATCPYCFKVNFIMEAVKRHKSEVKNRPAEVKKRDPEVKTRSEKGASIWL